MATIAMFTEPQNDSQLGFRQSPATPYQRSRFKAKYCLTFGTGPGHMRKNPTVPFPKSLPAVLNWDPLMVYFRKELDDNGDMHIIKGELTQPYLWPEDPLFILEPDAL